MATPPRKSARRHAKVESYSIAGLTSRFGPVGLIVYAEHYLSAVSAG
jgi:hypothetical protein